MKLGIQMYSVKGLITENYREAFRTVADAGYRNWEICQLYGRDDIPWNYGLQMPPEEAKNLLSELKVQVIGAHLTGPQLEDAAYVKDSFSYLQQVGSKGVGLGSHLFAHNDFDALKKTCKAWEEIGRVARQHGMRFYYHNHYMEFQRFEGHTVFDLLMENTDPELVFFELDTYWAMRAGADPVSLLRSYPGRIIYLHQKDFPKNYPHPLNLFSYKIDEKSPLTREIIRSIQELDAFAEIGTGCLPIQSIIDAGIGAGVEYMILEQDRTQLTEEESIRISWNQFQKYKGIDQECV